MTDALLDNSIRLIGLSLLSKLYLNIVCDSFNDLLYLICSRGPRAPSGDGSAFAKQAVDIGSTKGVMVTYVRDPGHFQVNTISP